MTNLELAKDLLATLRQALYNVENKNLATTAVHIETLLDDPDHDPSVTADEDAADPVG